MKWLSIVISMIWLILPSYIFANQVEEPRLEIAIGQWSYHMDTKRVYNETHDLFGIEYDNWTASTFVNSEDHRSFSVGRVFKYDRLLYNIIEPKINLLLITGYERHIIMPMVLLTGTVHITDHFAIDINTLPLLFISAGFRIKF